MTDFHVFSPRSFGRFRSLQIYFWCNTEKVRHRKQVKVRKPQSQMVSNTNGMFKGKMKGFCKNEDCPNSNELLAFQNGDLARNRSGEIGKHLAACEFCAAEVEFYSHYPQAEGIVEMTEIPAPLYELAEALLKNRHSDSHSLNSLLKENEELIADGIR